MKITAASMRAVAEEYIEGGWSVVPLVPGTKAACAENWTNLQFSPADFREGDNIGLRSVAGVVVSDPDAPEAVVAAARFLPHTRAVFGRTSKPASKRVYQSELDAPLQFKDPVTKEMLLELRVGHQDMCPPSMHPNGETLRWEGGSIPPRESAATAPAATLAEQSRHAATAALLGRYWPDAGRHDLRLAVARVLLDTLHIPDAAATAILETACRIGGSDADGIADAAKAVQATRRRLDAEEPATGSTAMAELMPHGRVIVAALRKWYGKSDAIAERIEQLNERFAIVCVGPKVVVMETWPDGGIKELWSFDEFRRLLIKERVAVTSDGKTKIRPVADVWLQDSRGRRYDRLIYAMPGSAEQQRPDDYNGWLGFTVQPAPGDWSRNREHLRRIICRNDAKVFDWVFNWLAALVQLPGKHAMTAIVLRGGEGTGKGHFAHQMVGALFHKQQYLHILGAEALTGRFNEHLSGKVLIYADESTWGGDPRAVDKLKGMVTESTIPIERKFLPLVEEPSALHIIIASNNEWPVSIPMGDRRFMVLDVDESEKQNDAYFLPLRAELANGGLAAFLHDLLQHKVDTHALRHPLVTTGKRDITVRSLSPIQRWWFEKLQTGGFVKHRKDKDGTFVEFVEWPAKVQKDELHDDYLAFLDKHHRASRERRATETEIGQFLTKTAGLKQQRALYEGKRQRFWELPTLAACRASWVKVSGWPEDFTWDE